MFFGRKPSTQAAPEVASRRQFPRVSSSCVVDYRLVDHDQRFEHMRSQARGMLQNISGGGVCVRIPHGIETGAMLTMNIRLPEFPSSVLALGKVVWSAPSDDGGTEAGVEFWWIGWDDMSAQERIRDFIQESLERRED